MIVKFCLKICEFVFAYENLPKIRIPLPLNSSEK